MANEAIIVSGSFTSTGAAQFLNLRFDPDWINVYNMTELAGGNALHGVQYYWQSSMGVNEALVTQRNAAANAVDITLASVLAVPGVTFVDTSLAVDGAIIAGTAISNATPPVVTTASTATLTTGDVVRLFNPTGAQQFGGYDFSIIVLNGTTFSLVNGPTIVAGTNVTFRRIAFNGGFYPRVRQIAKVTRAVNALVTFTVLHGYEVGEKIRFQVSSAYGMTQLDGLTGTVIATGTADAGGSTNTVTLDLDTTAFTAFAFPLTAFALANNYQYALATPYGENTAISLSLGTDILADSVNDQSVIGISLGAGITSPAGTVGQNIIWRAGTSPIM